MSAIELRPRFRLLSDLEANKISDLIRNAIQTDPDHRYEGFVHDSHIVLRFPREQRKMWSPQIDMTLEAHEKEGTVIRGHIGPSPGIWTFFMFLYFLFGVAFLFLLMVGYSQYTMYSRLWPLWVGMGCVALMGLLYLAAKQGQKKAMPQTSKLKAFVTKTLDNQFVVIPREEWQ